MSAPKSLLHPEQGTGEKSLPKSTSLPRQPSNGEISCPSNASHSKASQMSHWSTTPQVSGPEYRAYSSNGDDLQASARLDAPTTSLLQPSFVMSRFQSETPKESSNRVFGSYMTKGTRDAADIESEATHTFMASGDLANTAQKKK